MNSIKLKDPLINIILSEAEKPYFPQLIDIQLIDVIVIQNFSLTLRMTES
ncbi:hypothetical protein MNBD_GAMMA06-1026 [hydrothermal vent metagenome]|uniref:Uncharacterized protein n=1 Tax=hydrothermal vent metagenome TaxID=652676 RepID=A0A3B0X185_9ZZZZ